MRSMSRCFPDARVIPRQTQTSSLALTPDTSVAHARGRTAHRFYAHRKISLQVLLTSAPSGSAVRAYPECASPTSTATRGGVPTPDAGGTAAGEAAIAQHSQHAHIIRAVRERGNMRTRGNVPQLDDTVTSVYELPVVQHRQRTRKIGNGGEKLTSVLLGSAVRAAQSALK